MKFVLQPTKFDRSARTLVLHGDIEYEELDGSYLDFHDRFALDSGATMQACANAMRPQILEAIQLAGGNGNWHVELQQKSIEPPRGGEGPFVRFAAVCTRQPDMMPMWNAFDDARPENKPVTTVCIRLDADWNF